MPLTTNAARLLLVLLLVAVFSRGGLAQNDVSNSQSPPPTIAGLDELIQRVLGEWKVPGLAVAVVQDGKVVHSHGYGLRDVEQQLPVTPRTVFAIGSVSKSFTVTGLGMLVDEGKLDWDKPVRNYLPDFQLHDRFATEQMTARDLVTHRSGLPRHDFVWYGDPSISRDELYRRLRYLEPSKEFRSNWQYQNLMFMTAGVLAERITGTSWEEFTRQRIIEPLGMENTNFSVNESRQADDFALPYSRTKDEVKQVPFHNIDSVGPAGSINSNVEAMIRYVQFHIAGGNHGLQRLLSATNSAAMQTPQMVMPGPSLPDDRLGHLSYGLGLMITTYRGQILVQHGGGIDGFVSLLSFMPKKKIGVIVLTNLSGNNPVPTFVTRGVYDRLLGLEPIDWAVRTLEQQKKSEQSAQEAENKGYTRRQQGTSPSHDLADYAGRFEHPGYGTVTVECDGSLLRLTTSGGLGAPLEHFHYDIFQTTDEQLGQRKVTFSYDQHGHIDRLAIPFEPAVDDIVFSRVSDESMRQREFLEPLVGKYVLGTATITVAFKDDRTLTLTVPGQPTYELVPRRDTLFNLKGLNGYSVTFKYDASKAIHEVVFFQPNGTFVATRVVATRAGYQRPPKAITDILDPPPTPLVSISPTREHLLLIERLNYPTIANLAAPLLRLAGMRINPMTNGPQRAPRNVGLILQTLANGEQRRIALPDNARVGSSLWSPDGERLALLNTTADGIELWVANVAEGSARAIPGITINAAYGNPLQWMPDSKTLLVQTVVTDRGQPPATPETPAGPTIQESSGRAGPVRTYQDLLQNARDEALFDYYCTSQLVLVGTTDDQLTSVGKPAIFRSVEPSPAGQHIQIARNHRPYSYVVPASRFPREVEIWDLSGNVVCKLASLPLQDRIPIQGVATGPRSYHWRPTEPATLVWAEALDGGDPAKDVPHRDRIQMLSAPFNWEPVELATTQERYSGITWGQHDGLALLRDYDRDRRWTRTVLIKADQPAQPRRLVWERSINDRYGNPGTPMMRSLANGQRVIWQHGNHIFLNGGGATPQGDRPFLDRFDLITFKSERIFQCDDSSYESLIALVADDASQFITRYETKNDPPNYFLRSSGGSKQGLTDFVDPMPQLREIRKELVTYAREDGVQLSFTLYLPPGYQEGERLPTVVWAYPREYNDPATAGQVSGSTNRFTRIAGPSHLFFLTQGYAILDRVTMPVVGDPKTANDTFVEQIVASAKAAIDKADEMGVTDRNRVGVGGHSYGAFMTANLLAHCDLFRAGIARSGAYNRTLTPFGFQNERRTFWEAPDIYFKMSPFMAADKINEPILLVHGEADNNSGTFPIQSRRLYQAIRGNGGTARYVTLPHESHGYAARQSIEHTLYEMIEWFEQHVKRAATTETDNSSR